MNDYYCGCCVDGPVGKQVCLRADKSKKEIVVKTVRAQIDGGQYYSIDGKLAEIKRQMRQRGGYPYHAGRLDQTLQRVVEGGFASPLGLKVAIDIENECHLLSFVPQVRYESNWRQEFSSAGIEVGQAKRMVDAMDLAACKGHKTFQYQRWYHHLTVLSPEYSGKLMGSRQAIEVAKRHGLTPPDELDPLVACDLRLHLCSSDICAMGYRALVVFHKQIQGGSNEPEFLCLDSVGGQAMLSSRFVRRDGGWPKDHGLVFGGHIKH